LINHVFELSNVYVARYAFQLSTIYYVAEMASYYLHVHNLEQNIHILSTVFYETSEDIIGARRQYRMIMLGEIDPGQPDPQSR
jgi:hypothetical protein